MRAQVVISVMRHINRLFFFSLAWKGKAAFVAQLPIRPGHVVALSQPCMVWSNGQDMNGMRLYDCAFRTNI